MASLSGRMKSESSSEKKVLQDRLHDTEIQLSQLKSRKRDELKTEGEKREKEEQVACCEANIDGMKAKLQACQHYIHSLEGSLQEEVLRHAPLYGACLEAVYRGAGDHLVHP
ncbi:hypothetical protein Vadar_004589 [Vaccinium darrowii]|uniref:Uncharacterized protein n=1 Tax=Vaccinium darrowii TaxID=229202 RepID=A0ACB7XFM9_9ERIC|nr:hypothetical protein Vadar_004589 [Vaccinium darrowii]